MAGGSGAKSGGSTCSGESRSSSSWTGAPAYVRITQIPEESERRLVVKTRIIEPVEHKLHFNDKFSFEICQLNPSNRLVIGLWAINSSNTQDHLVGCFSFRIKNLLASAFTRTHEPRPIPHWYHLLPLDIGLQRHFKCSSHSRGALHANHNINKANNQPQLIAPSLNFPHVNSDLQGMHHVTLVLVRAGEEHSYGFSLTSSCPCVVSKVGANGVAWRAGLRCGDFISRVNDVNVSRASCESVVKMIKQSKTRLVLEVYRELQQQASQPTQKRFQPIINLPAQPPVEQAFAKRPLSNHLEIVPEEDDHQHHHHFQHQHANSYNCLHQINNLVVDPPVQFKETVSLPEAPPSVPNVAESGSAENFARVYASLKYVDSVTSPSSDDEDDDEDDDDQVDESEDEQVDNEAEAEKLRRAAVLYISGAGSQRHAYY